MACCLSFLLWLALLQTSLAVNVPGPNGTVVTQILSATSSNPEVKVVEDRDLGKILVYPPQPKEFTVEIIARIMYPDDQYLEKISTVMVGATGVTIESDEIRNSLILATLKVAPGASGGRFSITYENEDNPNHKGCNVRLQPVEVRDVNGVGEADDVTITPWDTSKNIANNNIAWIDAHQSAQNVAPRMPQLEFRVPGLPDGLRIEAKLFVEYERPYAGKQGEDTVRIPANGNFAQVNGDTWQLYNEAGWQTELNERGFFGGDAKLTYQIKQGENIVAGPEEIDFAIGGENPADDRCTQYTQSRPGAPWYAYAIEKHESQAYNPGFYNQFWERSGNNSPINGGINYEFTIGDPLKVLSPGEVGVGGTGLAQVTGAGGNKNNPASRAIFWNWQRNVDAFLGIMGTKITEAESAMNNAQPRNPPNQRPDGQRPQSEYDTGALVPIPLVYNGQDRGTQAEERFSDTEGHRRPEDAVAIKRYNGATADWCSWASVSQANSADDHWQWNYGQNNYVEEVCEQIEEEEEE